MTILLISNAHSGFTPFRTHRDLQKVRTPSLGVSPGVPNIGTEVTCRKIAIVLVDPANGGLRVIASGYNNYSVLAAGLPGKWSRTVESHPLTRGVDLNHVCRASVQF